MFSCTGFQIVTLIERVFLAGLIFFSSEIRSKKKQNIQMRRVLARDGGKNKFLFYFLYDQTSVIIIFFIADISAITYPRFEDAESDKYLSD